MIIINLCSIDWVAISALATTIMAIITGVSLLQNRKQLNELKRQWEIDNRPYIIVTINKYFHSAEEGKLNINEYFLTLENVGYHFAHDISIKFDENFKNIISSLIEVSDSIKNIENHSYQIKSKDKIDLLICKSTNYYNPKTEEGKYNAYENFLNNFRKSTVKITISYDGKYQEETALIVNEALYLKTSIIEMLDYIRMSIDSLKKHNN